MCVPLLHLPPTLPSGVHEEDGEEEAVPVVPTTVVPSAAPSIDIGSELAPPGASATIVELPVPPGRLLQDVAGMVLAKSRQTQLHPSWILVDIGLAGSLWLATIFTLTTNCKSAWCINSNISQTLV